MVKRYYCDYCDRSFSYSAEARKKHANGHHHKKLYQLHYEHHKTAKQRLQDELSREKCRRFHLQQKCSFGESCIYSHFIDADILKLKEQAREEDEAVRKSKLPTQVKNGEEPTLETWLSKRKEHLQSPTDYRMEDTSKWEFKYSIPSSLENISYLPPSLIPPSAESLLQSTFQDWG